MNDLEKVLEILEARGVTLTQLEQEFLQGGGVLELVFDSRGRLILAEA